MTVFRVWVDTMFTVFIMCILVRILLSWVTIAPVRPWPRRIVEFFHDTTGWYLNFFRRLIPPVGPLDLSPILAIVVVYIAQRLTGEILANIG